MDLLDGLVVVEATDSVYGAIAGRLFADCGAQVVLLNPDAELRGLPAFRGWDDGKIVLNVGAEGERSVRELNRLVANVDILFEECRLGQTTISEVLHAHLRPLSSRLIHCHVTDYGLNHPWTSYPPRASLVAARLGIMAEQPGYRPGPIFNGFPLIEFGTAACIVLETLAALRARTVTHMGQDVDVSMLDGALAQLGLGWTDVERPHGAEPLESRARDGYLHLTRRKHVQSIFRCADGEYVQVHTGAHGAFPRLLEVLGLAKEFALLEGGDQDPALLTAEQTTFLREHLPSRFGELSSTVCLEALWAADVAALPVYPPGRSYFDPHVQAQGLVQVVEDGVTGSVMRVTSPLKLRATSQNNRRPVRSTDGEISSPLEGLKVLDLGTFTAGPYASRLLADLGADVIKVESPAGDPLRSLPGPFETSQRGKRGITLDLKVPLDREVFHRLVEEVDVVHHNLRPGVPDRLGADYRRLAELKSDLVYVDAPGFGSCGPKSQLQSFAPLQAGFCGLFHLAAGQNNPPIRAHQSEDYYTGLLGAIAILVGVVARDRKGVGSHIEASQLSACLWSTTMLSVGTDGRLMSERGLDGLFAVKLGWG